MEDNITKILSKVNSLTEDFKEVKTTLQKQVDLSFENAERLKSLEELVLKQEKLIESLSSENSFLKNKIKNLEIRINQTEQDHLSNTIEIRGVPGRTGETPEGTVLKIGASLGIKLKIEDLDYVQKRRPREDDPRPPVIVARFIRRDIRDEVIRLRKLKRDFSTRHLDWDSDERIYLSEGMSPGNRHLYWLARQKKAAGKVKFVWFAGGRVRCRRDNGLPAVIINKEEDLDVFQ